MPLRKSAPRFIEEHLASSPLLTIKIWNTSLRCPRETAAVRYQGFRRYNDGTRTHKALKFVVPQCQPIDASPKDAMAGLGNIRFEVFQAVNPRKDRRKSFKSPEIGGSQVSAPAAGGSSSKPVRSSTDTHVEQKNVGETKTRHDIGCLLARMTMYYCTVPGLVKLGILPASPRILEEEDEEDEGQDNQEKVEADDEPKVQTETKRKRGMDPPGRVLKQTQIKMEKNHDSGSAIFLESETQNDKTVDLTFTETADEDDEDDCKPPAKKVKNNPYSSGDPRHPLVCEHG